MFNVDTGNAFAKTNNLINILSDFSNYTKDDPWGALGAGLDSALILQLQAPPPNHPIGRPNEGYFRYVYVHIKNNAYKQ